MSSPWGSGLDTAAVRGRVTGPLVELRPIARSRGWQWQFEGAIQPSRPGSWIVGKLGPPVAIRVLAVVWLVVFGPMLLATTIAALSQLFAGEGPRVLLGPLIPAFFMGGLAVTAEQNNRRAARDWESADRWLRQTLSSPDRNPGGFTA